MSCQSTTVKHILDLAQVLKDKMDQHIKLEGNKRTMNVYLEQLSTKEAEKVVLQNQLNEYKGEREQLADCQATLKRITLKNSQLKEKLQLQEGKLAQRKAMVIHMSTCQHSVTLTISNPVNSSLVPLDGLTEL